MVGLILMISGALAAAVAGLLKLRSGRVPLTASFWMSAGLCFAADLGTFQDVGAVAGVILAGAGLFLLAIESFHQGGSPVG